MHLIPVLVLRLFSLVLVIAVCVLFQEPITLVISNEASLAKDETYLQFSFKTSLNANVKR